MKIITINIFHSEPVESRSASPQIFSAPVSSQPQTNNPLTSLTTSALSLGTLQPQVNSTPYNSFQPQITSFLHQFEQFANNKTVSIVVNVPGNEHSHTRTHTQICVLYLIENQFLINPFLFVIGSAAAATINANSSTFISQATNNCAAISCTTSG